MFTTIMYGFINEVTRQPARADIPLRIDSGDTQGRATRGSGRAARPVAGVSRQSGQLSAQYRVLADSFKRAAGFQ